MNQGSSQLLRVLTLMFADRLAQSRMLVQPGAVPHPNPLLLLPTVPQTAVLQSTGCIHLFDCLAERMPGSAQNAMQTGAVSAPQSSAFTASSDKACAARQALL